jgi:hypothetical protein
VHARKLPALLRRFVSREALGGVAMNYTEIRELILDRTGLPGSDQSTIYSHLLKYPFEPSVIQIQPFQETPNPRLAEAQRLCGIVNRTRYELLKSTEDVIEVRMIDSAADSFTDILEPIAHDMAVVDRVTRPRPAWIKVLENEGYCRVQDNSDRPATLTCPQGFILTLYRDYLFRNGFTLPQICEMFRKTDGAPINPENLWKHPERALPFPKRVADALSCVT